MRLWERKKNTKQGEIERERAVQLCDWERRRKRKRKLRQEHREILQRNKVCVLGFSMGLKVSKGVSRYLVDIWDNIWFIVFVLVWNLGFCYVRFWGFTLFLKGPWILLLKLQDIEASLSSSLFSNENDARLKTSKASQQTMKLTVSLKSHNNKQNAAFLYCSLLAVSYRNRNALLFQCSVFTLYIYIYM